MKRIIITLFISLAIIAHGNDISAKYRKAPNFALFNLKGKLVTLSNLSKKGTIILSFWASYCKPCITEIPQLVELEKKYGVKKRTQISSDLSFSHDPLCIFLSLYHFKREAIEVIHGIHILRNGLFQDNHRNKL